MLSLGWRECQDLRRLYGDAYLLSTAAWMNRERQGHQPYNIRTLSFVYNSR